VSILATFLTGGTSGYAVTSQDVLFIGDGFEMLGIYTSAIPTEMIKN
jgi:hypothetical protein